MVASILRPLFGPLPALENFTPLLLMPIDRIISMPGSKMPSKELEAIE